MQSAYVNAQTRQVDEDLIASSYSTIIEIGSNLPKTLDRFAAVIHNWR